MRSLAVLVLAGALLALFAGCSTGDKQDEIEDATVKFLGDEIPEEEKRD